MVHRGQRKRSFTNLENRWTCQEGRLNCQFLLVKSYEVAIGQPNLRMPNILKTWNIMTYYTELEFFQVPLNDFLTLEFDQLRVRWGCYNSYLYTSPWNQIFQKYSKTSRGAKTVLPKFWRYDGISSFNHGMISFNDAVKRGMSRFCAIFCFLTKRPGQNHHM